MAVLERLWGKIEGAEGYVVVGVGDFLVTFMKLSQKFCESAQAGTYWDDQLPGFGLRVYARSKSFVLYVRDRNKRKHMYIIGRTTELSLAEAREKARNMKAGPQRTSDKLTVSVACDFFINTYAKKFKRSFLKDEQRITKYIKPAIGPKNLRSLTVTDCVALHQSIEAKVNANRVVTLLRAVINYAKKQCIYDGLNPANAVMLNPEEARDRRLSIDETKRIRKALEELKASKGREHDRSLQAIAIDMIIQTGRRKSDILSLRWSQVDFYNNCIFLYKSKTNKQIAVPITDSVFLSLLDLPTHTEFLFPSRSKAGHLLDVRRTWKTACAIAQVENAHKHDLRRALPSALAEQGRSALDVANSIGDTIQTAEKHYIRYGTHVVRDMLEQWSSLIDVQS